MKSKKEVKSDLSKIPGIGKRFIQDFARVKIYQVKDLKGKDPEKLFAKLVKENLKEDHTTSKNYLYVIRMEVHFANHGEADPERRKWSDFKDP